jgi:hypothetical protein
MAVLNSAHVMFDEIKEEIVSFLSFSILVSIKSLFTIHSPVYAIGIIQDKVKRCTIVAIIEYVL